MLVPIIGPPAISKGLFNFLYPPILSIISFMGAPIFTLTLDGVLINGPVMVITLSVKGLLYFSIS